MSARQKIAYQCQSCGAGHSKWAGQCSDCGEWNTLAEAAALPAARGGYAGAAGAAALPVRLGTVELTETERFPIRLSELARVLGGGLVPGSVILIGGDPGIGKSTLLLQALCDVSDAGRVPVLYVTGEESLQQVRARADRLDLAADELELLAETRVEQLLATAARVKPRVLVVDSVQTVFTDALQSAPGSVSQVRESAALLVRYAKQSGTVVFLVGHVTKEGQLAGPRVLEHMVDTVLYFESDQGSRFRLIRAIKNRFGAVNELGVFAMTDKGLKEVGNPSAIFLSRHAAPVPGSIIMVTREGSRPLLVEVQALVDDNAGSGARRLTQGLDQGRLSMLLAVLHRHGGVATHGQDVFANIVGGVRITETAADLPLLLAVISSLRDRAMASTLIAFGEVGLAGEIRPVPNGEERLKEAGKHGFTAAIVPAANAPKTPLAGMKVYPVSRLQQALDVLAEL